MSKTFTSNISVEFSAEDKPAGIRHLWKILNDLIDNEEIAHAEIIYTDEDFTPDPPPPAEFRSWYGYGNYPGKPI